MGIEYISEESIRNYTKAKKLCESLGETQHLFALLYGDWARYILPSKHKAGAEIADRLLALGTEHGETVPILLANRLLGWSKFLAGGSFVHRQKYRKNAESLRPCETQVALRAVCVRSKGWGHCVAKPCNFGCADFLTEHQNLRTKLSTTRGS